MPVNFHAFLCLFLLSLSIVFALSPASAVPAWTETIPDIPNDNNTQNISPNLKEPDLTGFQDIFTLPRKFSTIASLQGEITDIRYFIQDSPKISYISDNYTSAPVTTQRKNKTDILLSGWSGTDLDWTDTVQPGGSFIVSTNPEGTSPIKITIPSGTTEKGLLLYSKMYIPGDSPEVQFLFTGLVTQKDALLLVMRDTKPPYDLILGAAKPGSYDGPVTISIPELSGKNVAIVLGAYHINPDGQEWILSDFKLKGEEKNPEIHAIIPSGGVIGQPVSIALEGSGFKPGQQISFFQDGHEPIITENIQVQSSQQANTGITIPADTEPGIFRAQIIQGTKQYNSDKTFEIKEPELVTIEHVSPDTIVNNNQVANLSITGQNFHNDSIIILNHPEYGEIFPLHNEITSPSALYAVFPIRDVPPGEWNVIIRNMDTDIVEKSMSISIISPGTPIIREISPNSGDNADTNVTLTLKVDNFVGNGEIYLSRTGYHQIHTSQTQIPSSGIVTCKVQIFGEPTGEWNLTVRNPNGNKDTVVNGFTILGERVQSYRYITEWNLQKESFGKISRPGGLDITNHDMIAITDLASPRFFIFQPDGGMIMRKDLEQPESDAPRYPTDVTVADSGNIYVLDKWKNKVEKYAQNGDYLTSWGLNGGNKGEFRYPSGICVNSNEEIFVSDTNNHRIQKFNPDGTVLGAWGTKGSYSGQFMYPTGITSNKTGAIYVIDSGNDRVQSFSSDGKFLGGWGNSGHENGNFIAPTGIASDSSGYLYISDMYEYQVQKFNSAGEFETKWGVKGDGPGEFTCPGDIGVNSTGYVYVLDSMAARMLIFKPAYL